MSMLDETLIQQPELTVTGAALQPLALKDAPALIETVFPAQKVSFEAQSKRPPLPPVTALQFC